jgi:hypothetical protein
MCDVATLLGGADELYGGIGKAGQRAIREVFSSAPSLSCWGSVLILLTMSLSSASAESAPGRGPVA